MLCHSCCYIFEANSLYKTLIRLTSLLPLFFLFLEPATMASKHTIATRHAQGIRARFASRFLRSLLRVRRSSNRFGGSQSNDEGIGKRIRTDRIKIAAYAAMARAVGPRRTWSRALLFKLRNRARIHGVSRKRCLVSEKKRVTRNKVVAISREPSRADTLRKLVPGGDSMDTCVLLEETAHYIKCLATQVTVMQSIADRLLL